MNTRIALIALACLIAATALHAANDTTDDPNRNLDPQRWPQAKAWQWYNDSPWFCGFNYVPRNAISYTEMFMPYNFDEKLIDQEMALAQQVGFNCARVVLPFVVWEHDPDAFKKRLATFLEICNRHGLKVMPALFDDCKFGPIEDPVYGPQPPVVEGWYANGWTPSPGHAIVRAGKPTWTTRLKPYVQDLVGSFRDDQRIFLWDLYNEPTNGGLGDVSIPLVDLVFDWAREMNPTQPLSVAEWNGRNKLTELILARSDVVTFHDYRPAQGLADHVAWLKEYHRPLICTEWLNRGHGSLVQPSLEIFTRENVGCLHWGLVNGKTQTDLPWGHQPGDPEPEVWQHDLFRPDLTPWNPREIELFRSTIQQMRQR